MKHYNFSWRISDTNSGKQVLSPISAEDREYNPLTDIAVQGDALTLKIRSELKCFEYDEDKTFHEMSETLSLSLPTDKFAVQFFNNRAKIKVAKVREYEYELALKNEIELYQLSLTGDDWAIVKKMKENVPEYKSKQSKYETLDNN